MLSTGACPRCSCVWDRTDPAWAALGELCHRKVGARTPALLQYCQLRGIKRSGAWHGSFYCHEHFSFVVFWGFLISFFIRALGYFKMTFSFFYPQSAELQMYCGSWFWFDTF